MALQSFTWNNGTNDNPVSLNAQQLAALVTLAGRNDISKDVRGHITTVSGVISKYDKYVLNNTFENLVVHATDIEDSFSLVAAKSTINEGESTVIAVTGLAIAAVDFALEHTITGRSGIEESAVRSKIRMEGNYLVVDAPQENASWRDVVRVKAKPIYEEWSNSSIVRYVDVTVVATAISGITLLGVNKIGCGNTAEISIGITPSTSTKLSGLSFVNTLTSDGSLPVMQPTTSNGKIYVTAPAEECGLVLTTNAYLFGNTSSVAFFATKSFEVLFPHIRFVVTTDGTFSAIQSANPKITLQKVDDNNEPIGDSVELSGTTSGSSLIYEFGYAYGNGVVRGDGTEKFVITVDNVRGYTKTFPSNVVPNDVDTIINASYNTIQTGIYVVYSNGDEESAENVISRYSFASGKTQIFIKIITAECTFAIPFAEVTEQTNLAELNTANTGALYAPSGGMGSNIGAGVKAVDDENRDGVALQSRVATYIQNNENLEDIEGDPIYKCYNKIITLNGVQYHGIVPLWYHLRVIRMNRNIISQLLSLSSSTNTYPTTSTDSDISNRCLTLYRNQEHLMIVTDVPTNITSYGNNSYKSSRDPSTWSTPYRYFDTQQSWVYTIAPIYFIP